MTSPNSTDAIAPSRASGRWIRGIANQRTRRACAVPVGRHDPGRGRRHRRRDRPASRQLDDAWLSPVPEAASMRGGS